MQQTLLLCRDCGILLPLDLPLMAEPSWGEPSVDEEMDLFRSEHRDHHLEQVARLPESVLHDRPLWDPMSTCWFRVRAGSVELPVQGSRISIDEPRRYQVISDPPPEPICRAEIDEHLLRVRLDRHFFPRTLAARKLDGFVDLVGQMLGRVDPERIETSFDDVEVANAAIAPFPGELSAALLAASTELFDGEEVELLASFIEANRLEDGALAVRIRRDLAVAPA